MLRPDIQSTTRAGRAGSGGSLRPAREARTRSVPPGWPPGGPGRAFGVGLTCSGLPLLRVFCRHQKKYPADAPTEFFETEFVEHRQFLSFAFVEHRQEIAGKFLVEGSTKPYVNLFSAGFVGEGGFARSVGPERCV